MKSLKQTFFIGMLVSSMFSCNQENDNTTTPEDDDVERDIVTAELTNQLSNQVFVDLNAGTTTTVEVNAWELAFDQDGVIKSNTGKKVALAFPVESDFEAINEESATGLQYLYDDETGDLSSTAWNGNDFELNTPYILDLGINGLGKALGFKKFIISENSSSQAVLKYADLNGDNEQTVTVEKTAGFVYFSMIDNTINDIEPANWDLVVTPVTVRTGAPCFTMGDAAIPGVNCDIMRLSASVIINQNGNVTGAISSNYPDLEPNDDPAEQINLLTIEDSNFEEVDANNVADHEFTTQGDVIGKEWFHIQKPHSSGVYKVYSHITFLVNDEEGNHYKLRFLTYSKDGQNGYPTFEYQLIK
ncbi:HmuY family protein [Flammeovirga agarivorans]|uniref:HmuY protein n=1 Tax=Flammeovirga agarivorans TaxID=2726742 RepID=A0A7X8SNA1_9BACT|nr:HmuY family protein [Flammeovirga agarivorans]NLR93344.1 hypothetical protein [Flammeovirga agarivorans]